MAIGFYTQKITSGDKTEVTIIKNDYRSLTFTNTHTSAVDISLYVTSQLATDITSTTVLAAETEAKSEDSVTLTVDTVNATADAFLNEKVYKSTKVLYGTCTAVNSTTEIVFGGGLNINITDNDVLYTGTRYYILKDISIPAGVALKLHPEDFNYNSNDYKFYIDSNNASGLIDIITRY